MTASASRIIKSVILDRNFKGAESTELVTDGGDINNNAKYQSGKTWGSLNGTGELLYGGKLEFDNYSSERNSPDG